MALPYTPDLEKVKPIPTTPILPSPISLSPAEKVMADQSERAKGLPTPKTTPQSDVLIDSFKDSQVSDNGHAAQKSIERLRSGHDHTADFVPSWSPMAYPSTARFSEAQIRAADTLANSHKEGTLPQREHPVPYPPATETLHGRKRRLSEVNAISGVSEYATRSSDSSYSSQQTQSISVKVSASNRKARLAAYHDGKAKSDKAIQALRGVLPSNDSRPSQTVILTLGSKISTDWINPKLSRQEGGKFIAALNNCTEHLYRQRKPMEDAASRVVACGNTRWNRWNVPASELRREVKRWEAEQLALREIPKPRSRLNAKTLKKPLPALAEPVEVTRSPITRRRPAQAEGPSSFDTISLASQEESEYIDERPAKKTKTTFGKSEHSPKVQYDNYGGSLPGDLKTTSGKRKGPGEQAEKKSNNPAKRSKPSKKGNAESGAQRRGNGEGKAKNAKDKRLGDIKYWLCSKTQKFYAPKKPGDPVTPDHKGDWEALRFVRLPELGSKIDTAEIDFDEKLGPKGEYHGGDPKDLHRKEQELARLNNLTYDQYRCQKYRIFASRAVFDQISKTEGYAPSWGRTQTQLVGSIDANKSSYLYSNFDKWGWFDTVREKWDDGYLKNLVDDFQGYSRQPWTPPSGG